GHRYTTRLAIINGINEKRAMQVFRKVRFGFPLIAAIILGICVSAAASPRPAEQQPALMQFSLDVSRCQVHFSVSSTLHTVHGEFAVKRGNIQFDPDAGKAAGEIVVDATSGQSGSNARDKRMHKEILESDRFAELIFSPDRILGKVSLSGSSSVQVHGTFALHGASHELTVPVQVEVTGEHWTGTATFAVPYIAWGLKNPSNFIFKVSPTVNIDLEMIGSVQLPQSH
ncbi:MAG: YceI family protein, partial [Candidatus Acidiferrales bacterium]